MVDHASKHFFKGILSQAPGATGDGLLKNQIGSRAGLNQLFEFTLFSSVS